MLGYDYQFETRTQFVPDSFQNCAGAEAGTEFRKNSRQMNKLQQAAAKLGLALLDFVYPPHCLACGAALRAARENLCVGCWGEILVQPGPRCRLCSCPLDVEGTDCTNCSSWEPEFERALVLGPFAGAMQQAVHALKFMQQQALGMELGRRLGQRPDFVADLQQIDLLIPVPLHPARQRERGYNQSLCIARGLAEATGLPLENNLLVRRLSTRQQAKLDAGARRDNLRAAFRVVGAVPAHTCIGVVDDVLTTGATFNACARVLQRAGACRIWALALASPFHQPIDQAVNLRNRAGWA